MTPPNVGMNEDRPLKGPAAAVWNLTTPVWAGGADRKKPAGIHPVAEPGQAAEPAVVARSGVLRDEHEILD